MSDQKFQKVRIKATGEVAHLAHRDGASFYMKTHNSYNTLTVWVFFEETGEFRAYAKAALEELDD